MATRRGTKRKSVRVTGDPSVNVNDWLLDAAVRHAHTLEALKAGESARVGAYLESKLIPELRSATVGRLARMQARGYDTGPWTSSQLAKMNARVGQITGKYYGWVDLELRQISRELAPTEAKWQVKALKSSVSFPVQFQEPSRALLGAITRTPFEGRTLRQWTKGLSEGQHTALMAEVNKGLAAGTQNRQIWSNVARQARIGIRQAQTLTRTTMSHVASSARIATFKENGDLISGEKWVSTLDTRTTEICIGLDGKVFKLNEGPRPPAHHQCRSVTTPVVKTLDEIVGATGLDVDLDSMEEEEELRASLGGQTEATTTYGQWFGRQPATIQDAVVGPTRGRLIRSGKLSFSDLSSSQFPYRRMTLAELQSKGVLDPLDLPARSR